MLEIALTWPQTKRPTDVLKYRGNTIMDNGCEAFESGRHQFVNDGFGTISGCFEAIHAL